MKNLLRLSVFAAMLLSLSSCSVDSVETNEEPQNFTCSGSNPEARLTNNGTIPFTFRIYNSNFSMVAEHIDVAPGSSTPWNSFQEGEMLFSIENNIDGVSDIKKQEIMNNCTIFDLTVDSSNILLETSPVDI